MVVVVFVVVKVFDGVVVFVVAVFDSVVVVVDLVDEVVAVSVIFAIFYIIDVAVVDVYG